MDELLTPLTDAIVESIGSAESLKKQKVKKTIQIVGLWTKAAKYAGDKETSHVQGMRVVNAIEASCDRDKSMGNLKSKSKEVLRLIKSE